MQPGPDCRSWPRRLAIALAAVLGLVLALAVAGAVLPNAREDPDEWRPSWPDV